MLTKWIIIVFVMFFSINCMNGSKQLINKFSLSKVFFNKLLAATIAIPIALTYCTLPVHANIIGEFETSGFIFKDTLKLQQLDDPKVQGVAIYLADFERPITDRLKSDFFSDPSSTSLTCVKSGPIVLADNVDRGSSGEEVFEEKRNLFFKSVKVRRIVDKKNNNLIYVSYATKLNTDNDNNKSRYKSSLCSVHID